MTPAACFAHADVEIPENLATIVTSLRRAAAKASLAMFVVAVVAGAIVGVVDTPDALVALKLARNVLSR